MKKTIDTKVMAVYNPKLKVIAYDMNNADGRFTKALLKMLDYIKSNANSRGEKERLYAKTEPILDFPRLKGFFLENFGGYKRI